MPDSLLRNLFRNAEECKKEVAHFNGNIPNWLQGTFMRTGPGRFDFQDVSVENFFDGYAILSRYHITGDTVTFQTKFLETEAYKKALIAQRPVFAEFGTKSSDDPTKGFFSKCIPSLIPELTDNGNVSLFQIGSEVFACGETCYFHNISPSSLKHRERFDSSKQLGMEIMSAHPLADKDGSVYNIGISFKTGLKYNIVKINPVPNTPVKEAIKKAKVVASIPCSSSTHISYMHSFGMTKNYIICIEQPYGISVSKVLAASMKKHEQCQLDWMDWREGVRNRFFLVHKETGKVIKTEFYSSTPFFFFHVVNCYEENDQIIIDMPTIKDASFIVAFTLTRVRNGENESDCMPVGKRFVIPIVTDVKSVPENVNLVEVKSTASAVRTGSEIVLTPEILVDEGLESPTINRQYLGKKYNYYYATGSAWKTNFINCVSKVDTTHKKYTTWKENEFCFMEEPLFVPDPKGKNEDDGVLLCVVTDVRDDHEDFLIVLNAKNMEELGRAKFKSNLPHGIHGLFIPSES